MSEGHFIGRGDKTTCGGIVLDGDARVNIYGLLHAREGGEVTCGIDGKIYQIVGGISHIESHGKLVAGTLDSFSSCPCRALLIPSVYKATYTNPVTVPRATRRAAEPAAPPVTHRQVAPTSSSLALSGHRAPAVFNSAEPQEPGFYVVPKSMTREALEAVLFPERNPAVMSTFQRLNPYKGEVKAGSIIVLSDPNNTACTYQEALLMRAAQQVTQRWSP